MKRLLIIKTFFIILIFVFGIVTVAADSPSGLRIVHNIEEPEPEPDLPADVDYDFPSLAQTSYGWTDFEALVESGVYDDARVIFVSESGNDSTGAIYDISDIEFDTDGMFQAVGSINPYRTIAAAYQQIRDGYPDILLFNRGDEWTESIPGYVKSGRGFYARHIIASYGSGDRPQFFETMINARDSSYLIISGLRLYTNNWETSGRAIEITGDVNHQLYEDLKVDEHYNNKVQGGTDGVSNVAFRRCIFTDHSAHDGVFYAARVTGLLYEGNVFYRPREPSDPDRYGRHLYLSPSGSGDDKHALVGVILRGNIFALGERESVDVRSGGVVDNNLFLQNDLLSIGGRGGSADSLQAVAVTNNVHLEGSPNTNDTNQLNLINIYGGLVSGNIWTDPTNVGSGANAISIMGSETVFVAKNITIRDNLIYGYQGSGSARGLQISSNLEEVENITISSNEFQYVTGSSNIILHRDWQEDRFEGFTYRNNKYYSTSSESDWFIPGDTLNGWIRESGETGAESGRISYPYPDRTIKTYNDSLGGTASTEAFIEEVLNQSRYNWRPAYTAAGANNYIRAGFGK